MSALIKIPTLILAISIFFCMASCSPSGPKSSTSSEKTVKVDSLNQFGERELFFLHPETGKRNGTYQRWSKSGVLLEESYYSDGQLDQMRILYFENGDTQIVENYRKGIFEGPYKSFYSKGNLQLAGQYQNNQMDGIWTKYYENGDIMEKVLFSNNKENGPFTEYYPGGKLKAEGNYRNGDNEHGTLKLYDENGRHVKTMECQEGICRTTWRIDG